MLDTDSIQKKKHTVACAESANAKVLMLIVHQNYLLDYM